ncbi:uncharacterized protein K452DRAFT_319126 [Aplosporella prunicola CBS 121167]|uniref:WSC domain-containing protein n=1 Tax=Aplosporella prunicola CBS 121167 TaxID=1176127 RepID=A0A6A6BD31_9PEZI|nr:uncharacterized protein K452DRAFT_319126 [Aplosporella prunicola CBS 121167]KAF2140807.1 hypothetical protein K452DRAFT_319126 [Aplosporella prunicola CBS 121167]
MPSLVKSLVLGLAAASAVHAQASFIQTCTSRLLDGRLDPIVNPGRVSYHSHVVSGGNDFNFSTTYEDALNSPCSSCAIKEDPSIYWAPKLYFHAANGSFISVPLEGDDSVGNMGGMLVRYSFNSGPSKDKIEPFPEGFRMLAGNPFKRVNTRDFTSAAVGHTCLGPNEEHYSGFPPVKCPGGIRTEVTFPNCWNGAADVPDHQSHVSYPVNGTYLNGPCPAGYEHRLPTVAMAIIYRTDVFNGEWDEVNGQPFVLAPGDPTGYGMHGDFINGWNIPALQDTISACTTPGADCPPSTLTRYTPGEQQMCKIPYQVDEQVTGVLDRLPGCNPLTTDFLAGIMNMKQCALKTKIDISVGARGPVGGWPYIGCASDWVSQGKLLKDDQFDSPAMTPRRCIEYCQVKGYTYAGLEMGRECYCGNTIPTGRGPKTGIYGNCNMPCTGDNSLKCGGNQALQLYQRPSLGR